MRSPADELARHLAREAQAVCRHYLSNGRRAGRYWLVGDVANTPGRSLFVRLKGPDSGKGAAGKWTDAATGDHGDLLDLIALNRGLDRVRDVLDEARTFLRLPRDRIQFGSIRSRAFCSDAIAGIRAPLVRHVAADRGHDRGSVSAPTRHYVSARQCRPPFSSALLLRSDADAPTETWPALIAAVTDLDGTITGVHRTWLDPLGRDKAPSRHTTTRDGPSSRATASASVWRMMSWRLAKVSRPCCRSDASCPPCRWWRHFRPRISPPFCSRQRCAASTSPAMTIQPETARG